MSGELKFKYRKTETNSSIKWQKLETRFVTFEFVILKLFQASDFVVSDQ